MINDYIDAGFDGLATAFMGNTAPSLKYLGCGVPYRCFTYVNEDKRLQVEFTKYDFDYLKEQKVSENEIMHNGVRFKLYATFHRSSRGIAMG